MAMLPINQSDPLGLAMQQRAGQVRLANASQGLTSGGGDPAFLSGPLPDPQWDATLQALHDTGGRVSQAPGAQVSPQLDPNDPTPLSLQMLKQTNQLGTGGQRMQVRPRATVGRSPDATSQTT